ncbi:MAG TPA: glycoside hydrolase family 3 N-terminal domain-containing protein [Thermoanaerobaculia bacterium]|nr:glycoside hydrolase family 3 N-terminal domain-containing protein [Thermoanaerobaculia bacterium]
MKTLAASCALLFLATCATVPHARRLPRLEELSLDEKIGQLFVPDAWGVFMSASSPAYKRLLHHVRDNHVGGFMWHVSNVYEAATVADRLQAESRVPLLIAADLESGIGMRFADTTFWPWAMAVGATGDPSLAEAEGRIAAQEARAVGVNYILAPVVDVNIDPDNPVINTRSFGEDPQDVSRFATAFIRGVQSEHVLACAKHFPGHGDTHIDSHRSLPVLDVTRERLDRVELVPFRAAIAAGVDSIMPGHLAVPALDPTPVPVRTDVTNRPYGATAAEVTQNGTLPATISKRMLDGLLRRELGFRGLVVTDAFDMGGLTEHFDAGEAAVRAIEAGEDLILLSPDVDAAVAGVKAAVKSGRLSEARIDESVRRVLAAKAFVAAATLPRGDIFNTLDAQEHRDLAATIARRSITLVREAPGALPLKKDVKVSLVVVSEFPETADPVPEVERELRRRLTTPPSVTLVDSRTHEHELPQLVADIEKNDLVVLALAVRTRSGAGHIAVPETARKLVAQLRKPIVAVSFGTPYLLREIPSVGTYLCAYGVQPVMQVAAVYAVFGEAPITGKLPVTIPGYARRGDGIDKR